MSKKNDDEFVNGMLVGGAAVVLGIIVAAAMGSCSKAEAATLPANPPAPGSTLYMHLTLPETRDTATYVCTRVERRQANDPRNFR